MYRKIKRGQIYRAFEDVPMIGLVLLNAAASGGFYCSIPKGTRIVIDSDPLFFSKGTYVLPLNYKELEEKLVPLEERQFFKYRGYVLSLNFKNLRAFVKEPDGQPIKFDDKTAQKIWDENSSKVKSSKNVFSSFFSLIFLFLASIFILVWTKLSNFLKKRRCIK
jgi:hypothetical protein